MILKLIFRFFFWMNGWTVDTNTPDGTDRCVMIASPHTSNWDLPYMVRAFEILGIPLRFTIKNDWTKGPFGGMIEGVGGIGIDRSPKKPGEERLSMVEAMANLFTNNNNIAVVVTPEGTRGLRTEWKTGFYHVAVKAGVPIALGYLDYSKKEAGVGMIIHPSGDMEADLRKIMAFYNTKTAKHPEKFSVDQRYL